MLYMMKRLSFFQLAGKHSLTPFLYNKNMKQSHPAVWDFKFTCDTLLRNVFVYHNMYSWRLPPGFLWPRPNVTDPEQSSCCTNPEQQSRSPIPIRSIFCYRRIRYPFIETHIVYLPHDLNIPWCCHFTPHIKNTRRCLTCPPWCMSFNTHNSKYFYVKQDSFG